MNIFRYISYAATLILALSCVKTEVHDWSWVDQMGKDYPVELEPFNSKWNLSMTNVIPEDNYLFNGSSQLFTKYKEESDMSAVLAVAEYLDKEIFPIFPEDMVCRYMPSLIYVASEVTMEYTDEKYDAELVPGTSEWKQKHTMEDAVRQLPGDIGVNHLTLSSHALSDPDLKFKWTSLIIERMLANINVWPQDEEFINFSEKKYREVETLSIYKYYQTAVSEKKTYFRCLASDLPGEWCYWTYCGSVRGSRCFYEGKCLFTEDYMREFGSGGYEDILQFWFFLTYRQDFADLLAYLITNTPDQREKMLKSIDGLTVVDRQGEVFTISRSVMEKKMEMVKNYMKINFNWIIE